MMFSTRNLALLAVTGVGVLSASAQSGSPTIEPGLERAVRWIWKVEPSPPGSWGLPLPAIAVPQTHPMQVPSGVPGGTMPPGATAPMVPREDSYTVKKGDALYTIGRRHKVPVAVLKQVNGLTSDQIRIGLVLRIPTPEEVRQYAPTPTPTPTPDPRKPAAAPTPKPAEQAELENLALQVFLDRAGFSTGPIDAQSSRTLQIVSQLYADARVPGGDQGVLRQMAMSAGEPLTTYTIKLEDYRFIAPPRASRVEPGATATPTPSKKAKPAATPPPQVKPTYQELSTSPMLAYRTPWEFVAERFHCNEAYLRKLNAQIRDVPTVGTQLRVPNVVPFAIERALQAPLQPPADPSIKATIVDRSRLEISKDGKLMAVYPLAMARPGLRGRDPWMIQGVIPRPMLATEQELRVKPQVVQRIFGRDDPDATPPPVKVHAPVHETLAAGPRNPVGIIWINLAKSDSTHEPLPYGLHGTSIPDHMATQEGIGGLRLTNWDIARAVRQLPEGTLIEWKSGPIGMPPVALPPM